MIQNPGRSQVATEKRKESGPKGQDLRPGNARLITKPLQPPPALFQHLDSVDIQIIELLRADGRMTVRALSQKIGVAEPTVGNRIKALHDSRVMKVKTLISLEASGRPLAAIIGIRTSGRAIDKIAADLSQIDGVVSVMSVLGRFDLCVGFSAVSLEDLRNALEKEFGRVRGVNSLECQLALEEVKLTPLWATF
jgi:DNA-binding Lrp family transcriptional regulator